MPRTKPPNPRRKAAKRAAPVPLGPPIEATVSALGSGGDGVVEAQGQRLFAPYTAPGDRIRARPQGQRLSQIEILSPGADRAEPICAHFTRCGGCALQHLSAPFTAAWKMQQVETALAQRGFEGLEIRPIRTIPPGTRRRAVFQIFRRKAGAALGFHEARGTTVIDLEACPILLPQITGALPVLREWLAGVLAPQTRAQLYALYTETGLDLDLRCAEYAKAERAGPDLGTALPALARLSVNGMTAYQREAPVIRLGQIAVSPPPGVFLQPSAPGEALLQELVFQAVGEAGAIADLFCGLGTFALPLSAQAKILAVDVDGPAAAALEKAASDAGRSGRVRGLARDLFRRPLTAKELSKFDAVVMDPPRAGAAEQARELAAPPGSAGPQRIAAVSCNPASFARDLRVLADGGWRPIWVQPVDQFPFSAHIECVALVERG